VSAVVPLAPLASAHDRRRFGGKASQLAYALGAGLPVPGGFALDVDATDHVAAGAPLEVPDGRWAVRSSALDEDGATASFAGQHLSLLHVAAPAVRAAVLQVHASATSPAALAYRARLGLPGAPRMAIVVQRMVDARVAGVLFTRHPTTRAHELVIESSWGLGEAVVLGAVTPDGYRLSHDGEVLERRIGHKDVEFVAHEGGTLQVPVDPARAAAPTLDDARLAALTRLARAVRAAFDGEHDLEWALDREDSVYLLQRRSITR
jgi:pyruvate,water dikinase